MTAERRALFVIAHQGYREEELSEPRAALEAVGVKVEVASSSLGPASGMQGGTVQPDLLYCAARPADYAAVLFVGGYGAAEYFPDRTAHELAREALRLGRVVAAICYGASVLAEAGLLAGRKATGWPGREAHLRERGAVWTGATLEVDGALVTARGPEAAAELGRALVSAIG